MSIWQIILPAVPAALALIFAGHGHAPKPKPAPVAIVQPVCYWHHYDNARRDVEVCDDHKTGRTRRHQ